MTPRTCDIDGCDQPHNGRGYCAKHLARLRKYGDPHATPRYDPWTKIDQRGPDGCWPWTKSCDRDGYAVTKINGRQWRVARWVLTQKLGRDLTADEVTRHTCDNRACCNPAHLVVGAAADNSRDMVTRGRSLTGDRHWSRQHPGRLAGTRNAAHVLTDDQVRAIRAEYVPGVVRQADLAEKYGVTQSHISQIVRGDSWRHIA